MIGGFYEYETNRLSSMGVPELDGRALHQMEAQGVDWARSRRKVSDLQDAYIIVAGTTRSDPFFHPYCRQSARRSRPSSSAGPSRWTASSYKGSPNDFVQRPADGSEILDAFLDPTDFERVA